MTGKESWPLGIMQEIEIWPFYEIVYPQTRICPREWDRPRSLELWDTSRSPSFSQIIRLSADLQKKSKRNCWVVDYLYLAREMKKLLNIKVTVIPIKIGALGTILKAL